MTKRRRRKRSKRVQGSRNRPKKRQGITPSSDEPNSDIVEHSKVPKTGFDYGVKPRIMSIFNLEFVTLWNEAKCGGIGYTVIDQYKIYSDLPLMTLGCENKQAMEKLFKLIKSWMEPPGDQSAVDVFFIEDEKQVRYFFCMTVNVEQLILRTFGRGAEEDYDVLATSGGIAKEFAISENYRTFKKLAQNQTVFVTLHKLNLSKVEDERRVASFSTYITPNFQSGFTKNDIRFCDKSSLRPNTLEYALVNKSEKLDEQSALPAYVAKNVHKLRRRQLRRFFPVTLARLSYNESFMAAKSALLAKYKEWQLLQAACNLFARANWPDDGYGKNADMIRIYQKLRTSTQDATEDATLTFKFETSGIEKQIQLDMEYLHSCVCPNSREDPKKELESKGYI